MTLLWLLVIGGANAVAADDNTKVTVNAPTITPTNCKYNGTIMPVIKADDGCSIVYVKSTSKVYTTTVDIDANKGVKTEDSNTASITDIVNKTGNRYISAYAVKDVNGTKYKSAVTTVTYTYDTNATTKTDITLSASSIALDMNNATTTANLNVVAKTSDGTTISGLTYRYEVYPEGIVEVSTDGTVTPKKAGTASITVIFDGNDKYNAATCVADVNVSSASTENDKVFYSIADIRHAAQSHKKSDGTIDKTLNKVAIVFDDKNPATVVAVMKKPDTDIKEEEKFVNSFFIVDNSNRGLWISRNNIGKDVNLTTDLAIGSKISGTLIGTYKEGTSGMVYFGEIIATNKINKTTYTTSITVDHSGEENGDIPASYPYTEVKDVNTIAATNGDYDKNSPYYGDIVKNSYGVYLNTIIKVPGTIKTGSTNGEYYLVQDETVVPNETNIKKRIYFNSSQIDVNLADYVNTSGIFEGILVKRNSGEAKLIVLKNNFFQINKIYLDENDPEERITELVNAGAFDDEVDVYVHRTKLVNNANAWNTLCFPFNMTKDEFKTAFGCELTALAKPTTDSDETSQQWEGKVSNEGVLAFTKVADNDLNIVEGVPYLMQASGTQTACTQTIQGAENMTPQDLITKDKSYYAHIGQKFITVVPPYEIKANHNNDIVNGDFYFRGLYGRKKYTEDSNGKLTTDLISDNGSQKYQYISTAAGNYLRYLPSGSKLQFNGMRAYFYFPNWDKDANNKIQPSSNTTNSKIHIMVLDNGTTGINNIPNVNTDKDEAIYNLAGQKVDKTYKGIVIKNGKKYLNK